ncbi:MAG: T9SS type A sorting domain-containing protein [Saprospiraceae bacterium]|nr:T9SS type A sorting domain-containing protein [Saprospiraceae bacterium]
MVSRTTIPLVLGIWLSCLCTLPAQDLNLALQPDFFSFANVLTPVEGEQWLVGGEVGRFYAFPAFNPYLAMIDEEGNLLWERRITNISGTERGMISKIIPTPKGTFLVIGHASGCDYGLPGFIAEYDMEGNQLSFKEVFEVGTIVVQLPSGNLLTGNIEWASFGRVDQEEGLIWEQFLYSPYQFRLRDLAMGQGAQAYALGEKWLFQIDPEEGDLLEEIQIQAGVKLLSLSNHTDILLLQDGKLQRYDSDLALIHEIQLNSSTEFYDLREINEEIYLLGRDVNEDTHIFVYDRDLQVRRDFNLMDKGFHVKDLAYRNSELVFVGSKIAGNFAWDANMYYLEWPFRMQGSHIFAQAFNTIGQRAENPLDIAVEGISYQNTPVPEDLGYSCQSITFSEVEVKIENQGEEVLHSVSLNSRFNRCQGICGSAFTYLYDFDNLNLAPGESISLPVGDIQAPGIPEQDEVELCFWISKPNGKIDNRGANDLNCQRLLINDTPAIDHNYNLHLFPNPAQEKLHLDFEAGLQSDHIGQVYDALGRLVKTYNFPKGTTFETIDINRLSAGAYFFKLGGLSKRFVKY